MKTSLNGARLGARTAFAAVLALGLWNNANASSCTVSDVTIGGSNADSCGSGDPFGAAPVGLANTPDLGDPSTWDVNKNSDGGVNSWSYFMKQDLNPDGTTTSDASTYNGGGSGIDLQITSAGGNDMWGAGDFSVNAGDPLLIVLGDGNAYEYTWYLFTGYSGPVAGHWDSTVPFEGKDVSNISAYTTAVVPVPAAIWLFGSGLLGMIGLSRRRKAS